MIFEISCWILEIIKKQTVIFGYFLSCLLRAITATLSPVLTLEFDLMAADLGLLAGGYFLGFASIQIPLGYLLDRFGPKKIEAIRFRNGFDDKSAQTDCSKEMWIPILKRLKHLNLDLVVEEQSLIWLGLVWY